MREVFTEPQAREPSFDLLVRQHYDQQGIITFEYHSAMDALSNGYEEQMRSRLQLLENINAVQLSRDRPLSGVFEDQSRSIDLCITTFANNALEVQQRSIDVFWQQTPPHILNAIVEHRKKFDADHLIDRHHIFYKSFENMKNGIGKKTETCIDLIRDYYLFSDIKDRVFSATGRPGIKSDIECFASNENTHALLLSYIDTFLFERIKKSKVESILMMDNFSTANIKTAVRSFLDKDVWQKITELIPLGLSAIMLEIYTKRASSKNVSNVMRHEANILSASYRTQGQQRNEGLFGRDGTFHRTDNDPYINALFEERFGQYYRKKPTSTPHQEPLFQKPPVAQTPKTETVSLKPSDYIDREKVEAIIQRHTSLHREYAWLKDKDIFPTIHKVMATIIKSRETNAKKGTQLTDKKVYLWFRKRIETVTGASKTAEQERHELEFKIVAALMSGKPNGKLGF